MHRSIDLDGALNWLRNKGKDEVNYGPAGEFRKVDGILPVRKSQSMEERAREIEGALDWLRSIAVGCAGSEPSLALERSLR